MALNAYRECLCLNPEAGLPSWPPTGQERCYADLYKGDISPPLALVAIYQANTQRLQLSSFKRKPVACCFWINACWQQYRGTYHPMCYASIPFCVCKAEYASPNIFTVLYHAQNPQIPFWNGFVSLCLLEPLGHWSMSLPTHHLKRKFKQMQKT